MRPLNFFLCLVVCLGGMHASLTLANDGATPRSAYAGEQSRTIKSLSAQDIDALSNGRGWGLAKAAELNGLPGPLHLLEMRDDIALTHQQSEAIEALYQTMKAQAIPLGQQLIELERQLDRAFAERTVTHDTLRAMLQAIADTKMELRYVHLSTHLVTPDLLSEEQIAKYNTLRGYGSNDVCDKVPTGHDPAMWKRHNNCGQN